MHMTGLTLIHKERIFFFVGCVVLFDIFCYSLWGSRMLFLKYSNRINGVFMKMCWSERMWFHYSLHFGDQI